MFPLKLCYAELRGPEKVWSISSLDIIHESNGGRVSLLRLLLRLCLDILCLRSNCSRTEVVTNALGSAGCYYYLQPPLTASEMPTVIRVQSVWRAGSCISDTWNEPVASALHTSSIDRSQAVDWVNECVRPAAAAAISVCVTQLRRLSNAVRMFAISIDSNPRVCFLFRFRFSSIPACF